MTISSGVHILVVTSEVSEQRRSEIEEDVILKDIIKPFIDTRRYRSIYAYKLDRVGTKSII